MNHLFCLKNSEYRSMGQHSKGQKVYGKYQSSTCTMSAYILTSTPIVMTF